MIETDLCVIGAGSGGLSVAAGAVQMGARVVLVERGAMGGDCLNTGCVPSKSLLAAGHAAQAMRDARRFGVTPVAPEIDFAAVRDHVAGVIAGIAPHDSVERFEGLGVRVIRAHARFTGRDMIEAGGETIKARRFVIATGSEPAIPPVPGLADLPFLTNETIFGLGQAPAHLLVLGGGPIGAELAQAHRRLGAAVTIVERGTILPKDDPEAVAIIRARLLAEGITLHEGAIVKEAVQRGDAMALTVEVGGREVTLEGSHLLVAAGRKPGTADLGLEEAGVAYDGRGIEVDARLRTTNRRIFAIGDVAAGEPRFTHVASHHAGIVIRNALFSWPAKVGPKAIPHVTYTDPELAQVGLGEVEARAAGTEHQILRSSFAENDRARAERDTEGFVKVVVGRRGAILGATIVGRDAGELILPWVLAMEAGIGIGKVASLVAPYPTRGEASKRAAGSYYTPKLFSPRIRFVVRTIQSLIR
jgi:pyruvate/2-oxoglutarate dehydrogenase complex dihydrolipoamide dehydrogenase (E3) component